MSLIRGFTRLYSQTVNSTAKNTAKSATSKLRIQKALDLLQDSKFNFNTITEEEKQTYVKEFNEILSSGLEHHQKTKDVKHHFNQSLLGLNHILTSNNLSTTKPSQCTFEELTHLVKNVESSEALLNIFDDLVHNNALNGRNLRLILWNKFAINLEHFQNKIEFINHDGKYDKFLILVFSRGASLKSYKIVNQLYKSYMTKWINLRNQGELSPFLERALYQSLKQSGLKLTDLLDTFEFTPSSYILLIESLPSNIKTWTSTIFYKRANFTKNQKLFIETLLFLQNKSDGINMKPQIQKLLKISVINKVHKEALDEETSLTIYKHRFHTEMNGLLENLITLFDKDDEILRLMGSIHEAEVVDQPVLRFI